MNKKIIILSRISTSPQDIQSQTNDLIREAEKLGFDKEHQIIIESVESAIKLSEEERLGLRKMKHYIETDGNVDCVICWEPSRLARQQKILYSIRDYLVARKIQLIILNPYVRLLTEDRTQVDTTANIVFSLFATLSENEMSIKKERFQRARNEMRQRGQKFGGATIFGYKKNKEKKCVPHPLYSKIIVDIYNHYINTDASLHDTYLYVSGKYPEVFPAVEYTKGQHKIRHFFELEVYAKGNWCYPPLVTEEMWDKVHEKMSKARCRARYNCKRDLLCRGKIYCAQCGRMMTGSGGNVKAYCCNTDKLHNLQINIDVADWIIWEETRTVVNINSTFDYNSKIMEMTDTIKEKNMLRIQYETAISSIKQKMDKLVDIYMNDRIDDSTFNKKMDELKYEENIYQSYIKKLDAEISSYKNIIEETQKDFMRPKSINIDNVEDFETRQEFVRKYISKMIIETLPDESKTKRITFEYTHPIIAPRSIYLFNYKNQTKALVYRVNEDGTEDLIYSGDRRAKRNPFTGRFEKIEY